MEAYIVGGLVGFAIGAFLQRFVLEIAVRNVPPSVCDYCKWKKENEWRWNTKKDRHNK